MSSMGNDRMNIDRAVALAIFLLLVIPAASLQAQPQAQSTSAQDPPTDEVTPEDVKRFLDPTILTSGLDYSFEFQALPLGDLLVHNFSLFWAVNQSHLFFGDIPVLRSSSRGADSEVGVGDISFGYGTVVYQDLQRRLTSSVLSLEITTPSGDEQRQLGTGSWLIAPAGAIVLNPTYRFPLYIFFRYLHSLGGNPRSGDESIPKIRSFELSVQTIHILSKGFWLAFEPALILDPNSHLFSLSAGFGRALNRHFAVSATYVEHLTGEESFRRVFSVTLSWLAGG